MEDEELRKTIIKYRGDDKYHFSPQEMLRVILYQEQKINDLSKSWADKVIEVVREALK